jgi:hypothetical protein
MNAIAAETKAFDEELDHDCPLHAENPPFNTVTLAAMQEAREMMTGGRPAKWYHSVEEAREDLGV